jgi:hypothetical protein
MRTLSFVLNTGFARIRLLAALSGLFLPGAGTPLGHAQNINSGIIDPTNTYAGQTYSQWAAGWWQHYMSLPATNNPFNQYGSSAAPLGLSQSGPVWYIGGYYAQGGSPSFTNTIPGGVALFLLLTDIESDNVHCPQTNSYMESELRAFAKTDQDTAYGMTCTIDGVPVNALANGSTTPYRVQSVAFSYTCPPVHNILSDVFGYTCYQANTGIPFYVPLAVEDGVFLMVAPLSAGQHVIHVTGAYTGGFSESWTHHLTVQPVLLSVSPSALPGSLDLTWPQTPDSYTPESASDLSSPNWEPAGLTVTLSNGVYQTTALLGPGTQFFRLRLN